VELPAKRTATKGLAKVRLCAVEVPVRKVWLPALSVLGKLVNRQRTDYFGRQSKTLRTESASDGDGGMTNANS
jgi:hypothetical protein